MKVTSQSMMEFTEDGRAGLRPPGGAVAALLRTSDGGEQAHHSHPAADGPSAHGDGPRSRRNSASPPQTLSMRCAVYSLAGTLITAHIRRTPAMRKSLCLV